MLVCNNWGHSSAPKGVKVPRLITIFQKYKTNEWVSRTSGVVLGSIPIKSNAIRGM